MLERRQTGPQREANPHRSSLREAAGPHPRTTQLRTRARAEPDEPPEPTRGSLAGPVVDRGRGSARRRRDRASPCYDRRGPLRAAARLRRGRPADASSFARKECAVSFSSSRIKMRPIVLIAESVFPFLTARNASAIRSFTLRRSSTSAGPAATGFARSLVPASFETPPNCQAAARRWRRRRSRRPSRVHGPPRRWARPAVAQAR